MNAIHPEYVRIYRDLRDEELLGGYHSTIDTRHKAFAPVESRAVSPLMLGVMGSLLLVSVIVGVHLGRTFHGQVERKTTDQTNHIMENEAMRKRDADLDLVKRILSGVVDTMKEMSQSRKGEDQTVAPQENIYPRPIKVIVENATLRELPELNSKGKALLNKGTPLLAIEERENWLQVISPFGDEAWIRKDLVLFEDEK